MYLIADSRIHVYLTSRHFGGLIKLHKTINNFKKSQNASSFTKQNTDFCPSVSIFLGSFHLILQKFLSDYNSFHADHTQGTCLIKPRVTGTSILKHLLKMNLQRTGLRLL